jgi:cobalt-precorrin-5B (C1)-methyltransferase
MSVPPLKKGYTTGVHTSFAFYRSLEIFAITKEFSQTKTIKMDNDDLDVTKGCEIVVSIDSTLESLSLNSIKHTPYIFEHNNSKISIYAGSGLGVVTKLGLKPPPNHPAINPVPLGFLRDIFQKLTPKGIELFCTISITNGKEIAKQSANEKVGVVGGLSILGTTGFVKPVSSTAYIDSVKTEIEFAKKNSYEIVVFTLGNSAYKTALESYSKEQVIEIGNFVYDSIGFAKYLEFKKIIFICGIGKMTKVAQGFKNSHNRFGVIDFDSLKKDIQKELNIEVDIDSTKTVKGISEQLETKDRLLDFYSLITKQATQKAKEWFGEDINIELRILENSKVVGW